MFFLCTKYGINKSLALYLILCQVEATPLFFTLEISCEEDGGHQFDIASSDASDLDVLGILDGGQGVVVGVTRDKRH